MKRAFEVVLEYLAFVDRDQRLENVSKANLGVEGKVFTCFRRTGVALFRVVARAAFEELKCVPEFVEESNPSIQSFGNHGAYPRSSSSAEVYAVRLRAFLVLSR